MLGGHRRLLQVGQEDEQELGGLDPRFHQPVLKRSIDGRLVWPKEVSSIIQMSQVQDLNTASHVYGSEGVPNETPTFFTSLWYKE